MDKAARYTQGMTLEGFAEDEKTLDAVERNFITIGEAANHVPEKVREKHPDVPWREIVAMRRVVARQYFGIHPRIMWNAIHEDFPHTSQKLRRILESEA